MAQGSANETVYSITWHAETLSLHTGAGAAWRGRRKASAQAAQTQRIWALRAHRSGRRLCAHLSRQPRSAGELDGLATLDVLVHTPPASASACAFVCTYGIHYDAVKSRARATQRWRLHAFHRYVMCCSQGRLRAAAAESTRADAARRRGLLLARPCALQLPVPLPSKIG